METITGWLVREKAKKCCKSCKYFELQETQKSDWYDGNCAATLADYSYKPLVAAWGGSRCRDYKERGDDG